VGIPYLKWNLPSQQVGEGTAQHSQTPSTLYLSQVHNHAFSQTVSQWQSVIWLEWPWVDAENTLQSHNVEFKLLHSSLNPIHLHSIPCTRCNNFGVQLFAPVLMSPLSEIWFLVSGCNKTPFSYLALITQILLRKKPLIQRPRAWTGFSFHSKSWGSLARSLASFTSIHPFI